MVGEFGEAIGTAVEGGLIAGAVEGEKGAPLAKGHFAEGSCLNCGTELIGSHCHACGQKAHLHRTIGAFMHDLLHGALHFEGKTWKTLPKLAFKPGELTRRYIEGERARFVSPMALFLFSIFLMFAIFQLAGVSAPTDLESGIASAHDQAQAAQDAIKEELSAPGLTAEETAILEEQVAEYDKVLAAIDAGQNYDFKTASGERNYSTVTLTGIKAIDEGIVGKWRKNPGLMLYKLQTNFYKFSWLLIPLSVPFVWLLFAWKRKFKAYDHAIFVTYSLGFMTLLTIGVVIAGMLGVSNQIIGAISLLVPPIHIYKQLRGAYGLSRFSALWRLMVLSIFILIVLLLFFQLLLVIGAF